MSNNDSYDYDHTGAPKGRLVNPSNSNQLNIVNGGAGADFGGFQEAVVAGQDVIHRRETVKTVVQHSAAKGLGWEDSELPDSSGSRTQWSSSGHPEEVPENDVTTAQATANQMQRAVSFRNESGETRLVCPRGTGSKDDRKNAAQEVADKTGVECFYMSEDEYHFVKPNKAT